MNCFTKALHFLPTPAVPGMVANVTYESLSAKMIQLTWKEPLIPNGTIVSYHIVVNYYEDSTPAYSNTVHASGELSDEISSLGQ